MTRKTQDHNYGYIAKGVLYARAWRHSHSYPDSSCSRSTVHAREPAVALLSRFLVTGFLRGWP